MMTVANMAKAMDILPKMDALCTAVELRTSAFSALTSITGKNSSNTEAQTPPPKLGCNVRNLGSCHLENNA